MIDDLAVHSFVTRPRLIIVKNKFFLVTRFALLLMTFVGVGYEMFEKQCLCDFERDYVDTTHFNANYDFTRIVQRYMVVHVFADSP